MLQATFSNLISATRFKALIGRNLAEVACPKCGQKDSWQHCQQCYDARAPTSGVEAVWLNKINIIMNAICTPNPAMNAPLVKEKSEGSQAREDGESEKSK